jgi:MFS family permease
LPNHLRRGSTVSPDTPLVGRHSELRSLNFDRLKVAVTMSPTTVLRVFVPFALGYYFSYLYRSINAVISPDLVRDLGIDAGSLGLLTGAYLITFAAFQIPLGVLLDRYGARRMETMLLIVAAGGALVFAVAPSLPWLIVGRGLIGLGVSACLMASFRAFVDWFPAERLPFANGCMFAMGGLGAMSATVPIEVALQFTDWRGIFFALAGLTLVIAATVYLVVPEKGGEADQNRQTDLRSLLRGVGKIFVSPVFLRTAPLPVLTQGTGIAVLGLWLGPWLRDVGGLTRIDAAQYLLWSAAAMAIGYFLQGIVADRLGRRGWKTEHVALVGMSIFLLVQLVILLEISPAPLAMWLVYGFFQTSGGNVYASLSQSFPRELAGRVNTALNLLVFISAFAVQWGVGAIISLWPTGANGNFAAEGYRVAFAVLLAVQVAGLVWVGVVTLLQRRSAALA